MGGSTDIEVSSVAVENPIVVAVMGITGAGKSTFIQKATGLLDIEIGHELESCSCLSFTIHHTLSKTEQAIGTMEPKMHRCPYGSKELILVDTPGFDDTFRDDAQVLQEVATFLEMTYNQNMKLSGIIYLHDITKNRMTHGATANLAMFQALCGEEPLKNVILATTRWGDLQQEPHERAVRFEDDLKTNDNFWGGMVKKGSHVVRFENSKESALEILRPLVEQNKEVTLQIQQEMAVEKRSLANTSAGEHLNQELLALKNDLQQRMLAHEKAIEDANRQNNTAMEEFKSNEARKTQGALRKIQDQEARLHEDRRDEVRQYDMTMNQLRKRLAEHEVSHNCRTCTKNARLNSDTPRKKQFSNSRTR